MTTATRERGILFSAPMVRALLTGRKTQTRRVVTPQPDPRTNRWSATPGDRALYGFGRRGIRGDPDNFFVEESIRCPYGVPGDRLWVRETIALGPPQGAGDDSAVYVADGTFTTLDRWPWRGNVLPSIFLPRGLSRITLEIEDVRVERLQEMSYYDWLADFCPDALAERRALETFTGDKNRREDSARLWDAINGERAPWSSNPWVWVVTFRRAS